MDEAGMQNIRAVLGTLLLLTVATFGVLLWRVGAGLSVPDLLENLSVSLLSLVTGSGISLAAKPRVGSGTPTTMVTNYPASVLQQNVGGDPLPPDDTAPPEGEKNLAEEDGT